MNSAGLTTIIPIVAISGALAGCEPKRVVLSGDLKMSDSSSSKQLIAGFHGVEFGKWRWTSRRFAVVLPPPAGSERNGASLRLQLYIPDSHIQMLGPMTLTADVDDVSLGSETFRKEGLVVYSRKIPPGLLRTDLLSVVFNVDKASPPWEGDRRELAVVVTEVSLQRSN